MKSPLLDIPDDPLAWPAWLELQLIGEDLGKLVDGLQLVVERSAAPPSLAEICGPELPAVLRDGLSVLSVSQIRRLLKHPQCLLDLQEQIFCGGADYWQAKLDSAESRMVTASRWQKLEPQLAVPTALPTTPDSSTHLASTRRRLAMAVGTIAACFLVGLWLFQPAPEWGWNRPGIFASKQSPEVFLEQLALGANEYFQQPRESAADLKRQLADFRRGCDALLAAPLTNLAAEDREWLRERCENWSRQFDQQLDELDRGGRPWREIRVDADATVKKLVTALRSRFA